MEIARRKRILLFVAGLVFVFCSLLWMMKSLSSVLNPVPAFSFSAGVVAILGSIKATFRIIAKRIIERQTHE